MVKKLMDERWCGAREGRQNRGVDEVAEAFEVFRSSSWQVAFGIRTLVGVVAQGGHAVSLMPGTLLRILSFSASGSRGFSESAAFGARRKWCR